MKPIKVIFLDVDGVLNNSTIWESVVNPDDQISKEMVALVNQICDRTGAKVVFSSMWRITMPHPELHNHLKNNFGATFEVLGDTVINDKSRIFQISDWMDDNFTSCNDDFIVIDDDNVYDKQPPFMKKVADKHFFQTDFRVGLTQDIADKIILRFGEK